MDYILLAVDRKLGDQYCAAADISIMYGLTDTFFTSTEYPGFQSKKMILKPADLGIDKHDEGYKHLWLFFFCLFVKRELPCINQSSTFRIRVMQRSWRHQKRC